MALRSEELFLFDDTDFRVEDTSGVANLAEEDFAREVSLMEAYEQERRHLGQGVLYSLDITE